MGQSHNGIHYTKSAWDRIKIVVDKATEPYTATYHQIKNGIEIELRAACFICHANGPRAVRPNYESSSVNTL
jgi:cbb3-type cytochrome oxidase cytochrome c subunit